MLESGKGLPATLNTLKKSMFSRSLNRSLSGMSESQPSLAPSRAPEWKLSYDDPRPGANMPFPA